MIAGSMPFMAAQLDEIRQFLPKLQEQEGLPGAETGVVLALAEAEKGSDLVRVKKDGKQLTYTNT